MHDFKISNLVNKPYLVQTVFQNTQSTVIRTNAVFAQFAYKTVRHKTILRKKTRI